MEAVDLSVDKSTTKCCRTCGCRDAVGVNPLVNSTVRKLIDSPQKLFGLINSHGSPLNIVFPELVKKNWESFRTVLDEEGIPGEVLFTTKPNRSALPLTLLAASGASVDVSSYGALLHALACAVPGERIQASGPKSDDYLFLAASHRSVISLDSEGELARLVHLLRSNTNLPQTRVLVRLCRFTSERMQFSPSDTPFGIRTDRVGQLLTALSAFRDRINLLGFHYHTPVQSGEERVVAFENTLQATQLAFAQGFSPSVLNVGGGWKIRYAESSEQWENFQSYLKSSVLERAKPITWDGSGLGYRIEGGRLAGAPSFPDHAPKEFGAESFRAFLNLESPEFGYAKVGSLVKDLLLSLRVEPGRALLDQAGLTVSRVIGTKESRNGEQLIQLEMNHTNLLSREQKLLTQPIFLPNGERKKSSAGSFLFGNLCIESDLIQYMKVYPGFIPEAGDLVVFINTAAYHMDFSQSEILHQRVATIISALSEGDTFRFVVDSAVNAFTQLFRGPK